MTLAVGDLVEHVWHTRGSGDVTNVQGHTVYVEWHDGYEDWHLSDSLVPIRSSAQESEDTVVQKFTHGDQVVTTEGMFGAVLGEARRDAKGTYYKVAWENGSESINLAPTLTPVRESQRIAADHALNGATDTPFDTVTFNLLETLGWGEAALKADIFKLITTIDRSGHKVADAKELVEASKALLAMLERQGA